MKIPHEIGGRTRITNQPRGYLSDAGAVDFSPVSRGLYAVAGAATQYRDRVQAEQDKLEAREKQTQRFKSLTDFSNFETAMEQKIVELKRDADPSGQGVAKQIDDLYKRESEAFIKTLPTPELQEEFRFRSSETRGRVLGQAFDFQYKAGDAFYRQGIDQVYQKALIGLDPNQGGDPTQLEAHRARVFEAIDVSDLSEIEKENLKLKTSIGMEGVSYKQAYKQNVTKGAMNLNASIGQVIDEAANRYGVPPATLRMIAWLESKGDPNAQNENSSAGGLFQFIDDTARAYGLRNKFDAAESADAGARLARDNIEGLRAALGRDPTPGEVYLAHQQGLDGAKRLLSNPNALAEDIVGAKAVQLNGGAPGMRAREFANLWIRKAEGANANASLDQSPAFANLPYEDRNNLRADADRELLSEQTELIKAQNARIASQQNELINGIIDGTMGQTHIDTAYQEGWGADADFRIKAQNLYDKVNEERIAAAEFSQALEDPLAVWDPTDEENNKRYNAWFGQGGKQAFETGNADYLENTFFPTVAKLGDIPTDAMGLLTGMIRSQVPEQALYALDTLARLQDMDSRAFDMRTSDAVARDVDLFRSLRGHLPADELLERLGGGRTQEERQRRAVLQEEAEGNLKKMESGATTLSKKVEDVVASYGWVGGFNAPDLVASPAFARELNSDFQSLYIDFYTRFGDDELATAHATKAIQRNWGVSNIGGKPVLMKHPPEMVGYKPLGGSYDYIDRQLRTELGLGPDEKFQLISDQQTEAEYLRWKAGVPDPKTGKVEPASYMTIVQSSTGEYRLRMTPDGVPDRRYFQPTAEDVEEDRRATQHKFDQTNYSDARRELERAKEAEYLFGTPVPDEFVERERILREKMEQSAPPIDPAVEQRRLEQRERIRTLRGYGARMK